MEIKNIIERLVSPGDGYGHTVKKVSTVHQGEVYGLYSAEMLLYCLALKAEKNTIGLMHALFHEYTDIDLIINVQNDQSIDLYRINKYNDNIEFIKKAYPEESLLHLSDIKLSNQLVEKSKLSEGAETLFYEMHSALRDLDGLHSSEALDEICKLLYTKIYDEEINEERERFNYTKYKSSTECASSIRRLYREAAESDQVLYSNRIPGYTRLRTHKGDSQAVASLIQAP